MDVRRAMSIAVVLVAALTAACGDESANPLAPSQDLLPLSVASPQPATRSSAVPVPTQSRFSSRSSTSSSPVPRPSHARASLTDPLLSTIDGLVNGGSMLPRSFAAASTSLTVTATAPGGFSSSAIVDAVGRFTIVDVPTGDVELRFTDGVSVDARLLLAGVGPSQTVRIAVTVKGTTATLESESRSTPDTRVDVEGTISDVEVETRVLSIATTVVSVPTDDIIRRGTEALTLQDLREGDVVRVYGVLDGAIVVALQVDVLSSVDGTLVTREGQVVGLTGGCPTLAFTAQGTPIETTGATFFRDGLCTDVRDGTMVTVTGTLSDGTLQAIEMTIDNDSVEGIVVGLLGTCPGLSFSLDATPVVTDSSTMFAGGGCGDVREGSNVIVTGAFSGGTLRAVSVTVWDESVSLEGPVDALLGPCPNLTFTVFTYAIATDAATLFVDVSAPVEGPCDAVQNGTVVEVSGRLVSGVLQAASVVVEDTPYDGTEPTQSVSASIEGQLAVLSGYNPTLVLLVDDTVVRTDADTRVTRHGDVQSLAELSVGQTVHVVGDRQSNGSLDARKIQIKDDETGDPFRITGSLGGIKGTCPSLAFGINGFSITTNDSTEYSGGSCGVLASGLTVTVDGTAQADGSAVASRVRIVEDPAKRIKLQGAISLLAGTCPTASFSVDGGVVLASIDTRFRNGTCDDLVNGMEVKADGTLVNGIVLASTIELSDPESSNKGKGKGKNKKDDPSDDDDSEDDDEEDGDEGTGNGENGNGGNGNSGKGKGRGKDK